MGDPEKQRSAGVKNTPVKVRKMAILGRLQGYCKNEWVCYYIYKISKGLSGI